MKKLTLILVAIFAMVNVANAQRAWAYDLELTPSGDSYTFDFKAVTAGDATLVFYKEGVEAGTLDLGSVSAGDNTVTKTSEELLGAIQQSGDFTWGVKMTGEAIAAAATLSLIKSHIYYNMMGVVTDLDTESKNFGRVYLQMSFDGKPTYGSTKQTAGFFEFDPLMNLLSDDANNGVKPQLPQGYTLDGSSRDQFHRLHINPKTGDLVFSHNIKEKPGVFAVNPDNLSGDAKNLLDGITGLTGMGSTLYRTSAHCFDNDGALFVMDIYPYNDSGYANGKKNYGYLYKIVDGQAVVIDEGTKWANASIAMASDGRGGLWIAQNRSQIDGYYQLAHIKDGVDFAVDEESDHGFSGAAERGAVAYDQVHNILAWGRERKVMLFDVSYDETTGIPMLTKIAETEALGRNIDCLAFDYAGDLYVGSSSSEIFYKYAVPTNNNTCTTPAKKAQMITLVSATQEYTVTINKIGEGEVTGASTGTYLEGSVLTLTATPAEHYTFTGWTGNVTSTDIPLTVTVDGDKTITANFVKNNYTLTVNVNDDTKGSVNLTSGTYEAEKEVEITATANTGYEFVGWSNGSKENPLTISMEEDTELTANFRAILPSSITLNAHPVKDYSASIVGTMKRAIQYGENTIVLTHEDNGTPHIYNIAHTTKTVTEISQEGVNAAADGFLSISDIALTEDGKLVACNYEHCTYTASNTSYFYIWDDIAGNPRVWFTSQKSGNYTDAYMGYTMALKGTSQNSVVTISAFNKNSGTNDVRFSHHTISDGVYVESTTTYKYLKGIANKTNYATVGSRYELNASPLAETNWIIDGENITPMESDNKAANAGNIIITASVDVAILGKKYNGASYLFHNDHHLMIAPYATDDKLAGIKVLGITDGFGSPVQVETNTALVNAIDATTAAATAYVDGDGDLTIYLIADGKVYTFSEKVYTAQTFTVTASAGEGGSVEGGGTYEEGATATLTATPDEHYDFVNWTVGGSGVSTDATYSFEVTTDVEVTANFQEHTKYTITAHAADNTMGYVTGGKAYYAGETVTLKAVANSTYYFVNWSDGVTDAIRTFTATADVTLTANFAKATPRAWAYDLRKGEDGENYTFTFKTTSAGTATLIFKDKDGTPLDFGAHTATAIAAEEKTITIAKSTFEDATKDIYWSVELAGEAITKMAEITDPALEIYDFYSTLGVVVDNNPESEYFGKIYVQATLNGDSDGKTPRARKQKAGLFIYDQKLDELNPTPNTGIQPSLPSGYSIGGTSQFNRLAIDPTTNNITYCYAVKNQPAVFSMDRANLTGTPANLLAGQTGITRSVAHCFDQEGNLYVMDLPGSGQIFKIEKNGTKSAFGESTDKYVQVNTSLASDGRGGLWVSQNRGQIDTYYQLVHYNASGTVDFAVYKGNENGFTGGSYRGALAYDINRQILAQGRDAAVELFNVTYDETTGVPTLTKFATTPTLSGANIDGLAFDYAGDLYVVNSGTERFYKYVLPTNTNTCTVPAPESQVIIKEVRYTVTVNTVGNGTAIGAGEYVAGETATLEASPAANHQFVNWTYESETSTDNPLELVVNSDITVTANFAPVQYTLIAPTNDENKGTVTGAGTYNHGAVATLTASPKPGYKLLYWSDRSTENPRTITMTKNEAISAYFVKEYTEEPTFKIEKVWENTQVPGSADGYQAVGWDGNIYMQNKTAGKIKVYTNDTDAAVDYATSNTSGQQIAVDEAGNLIVFNAYFASATPNAIQIYQKGSTTAKAINFTLPNPGRCDFLSASGDIYSAEGGYVYFYCQSTTVVNRVKIANGELVSVDVVGNNITAGNSQNHVMVDIFGNLVAHSRSAVINATINVHTNESMPFALIDHKHSTLGGCTFELGGKELWAYNVGTTHYNSEWNLYNMTDKVFMSNETLYAKDKVSKKELGSSNWLNVQVVDENTAYIYQFCPEVAVAVWKVTCNTDITVTIDENDDNTTALTPYEGETVTATVTRNFGENKILTLTLPFDMSATQISTYFGNATVYEFYNIVDAGEEIHLQFYRTTSIEAGKPYILQTTSGYDAVDGFTIEDVVISTELHPVDLGEVTMVPVLDGGGTLDQSTQYYLSNNALYCAGDYEQPLLGLRAFFTSASPTPLRARVIFEDNEATSIPMVTAPENKAQKVIKDGRLIIIRGEQQYNAQGQRIE